ncbi:MAG: hypothetical protein SOZ43_01730 [Eubacteriales bacterium]|nr:hypothetical protein [Eubacteriales bacterium]
MTGEENDSLIGKAKTIFIRESRAFGPVFSVVFPVTVAFSVTVAFCF